MLRGGEHLLTVSKLHEPRLLPGVCGVLPRPRFVSPPNSWSLTPGVQPCAELLQEPFPPSLVPVRGCAAMLAGLVRVLETAPGVPLWFTCPSASEAHEAPSGTLARCPT